VGALDVSDRKDRAQRLYQLMHFWSLVAVRYPWVRMTENAEVVAVWLPPGEPEMTTEEEVAAARDVRCGWASGSSGQ
jgi:hypothetical protein